MSINVNEKAALIWSIADKLTGAYKPHEYGEVILPMTVLKRFDSVLSDTKDSVVKKHEELKDLSVNLQSSILKTVAGHDFYNVSKFDFEKLLADPDNIEVNFKSYIAGFSENALDIIKCFNFDMHISRMAEKNLLFLVIQEFTTEHARLHPKEVANIEMGYIFEEIVRRFSESHNEEAGQHYTPKEVIELMVNLIFSSEDINAGKEIKTIYDPACGTGGMLTAAEEYLRSFNSSMQLLCFGQEINDQTYAICKADMLIKGSDDNKIKNGDTLADDKFKEERFDYILCNPPFGREWKVQEKAVKEESKQGDKGRFGAGFPAIRDGQMLFLQAAIGKMKPQGSRVAIIHNGSPLFSGDAGSGESNIRKYIIENDLLEVVIALPNDIFYNTGITTYVWVLTNNKAPLRKGKIQLINANDLFEKRRKSLGNKRNNIAKHHMEEIIKIHRDFTENEKCKIFSNEEFGYNKITIEQSLLDGEGNPVTKKGKVLPDTAKRQTENVPLSEDIQGYFKREIQPFMPDAWVDKSKTKVGYEIPFNRYFYKYEAPRSSSNLMNEILQLEEELDGAIKELFDK